MIGGLVIELQLTSPSPDEPFVKFGFDAGIVKRQAEFVALGFIIAGTVNPFVYGEVINITDSSVCGIAEDTDVNDSKEDDAVALDFSISLDGSKRSAFPFGPFINNS